LALQCDESGVTQTSISGDGIRLTWDQIAAVYAYKRDCFTMDQIRLIIGNDELEIWIEIAEDDAGYADLVSYLPRHLPGCPSVESWLQSVALPSFETQWTKIYRREPAR